MAEDVNINFNLNVKVDGEVKVHHYHHHSNPSQPGAADILNSIQAFRKEIMTQLDTSTARETGDFQTLLTAVEGLEAAFEALKGQNNAPLQAALDAANLDSTTQAAILDANDTAIQAAIAKVQSLLNVPAPADTTGGAGGNDTVSAGGGTDTTGGSGGADTTGGAGGSDTVSGTEVLIGINEFDTGTVGQAFSADPGLNQGTSPYHVTSTPQSDNGLTVAEDGTISGTPTVAGTSTFNYSIQDSATPPHTGSGTVTVVVTEAVQAA